MGMREEVLKHVRRIESCHSRAEVEACINLIIIEAAFQAAERMKEEAAMVADEKYESRAAGGFPREASTARALRNAIRAIDANKLFGE